MYDKIQSKDQGSASMDEYTSNFFKIIIRSLQTSRQFFDLSYVKKNRWPPHHRREASGCRQFSAAILGYPDVFWPRSNRSEWDGGLQHHLESAESHLQRAWEDQERGAGHPAANHSFLQAQKFDSRFDIYAPILPVLLDAHWGKELLLSNPLEQLPAVQPIAHISF